MKKIFISYRRSDAYDTNRIVAFLKKEVGANNVFADREMLPGQKWPDSIRNALSESDLMLLIIGPDWLYLQDEHSGRRRIDMETDWVRLEINRFLEFKQKNENLVLIPVLVNGAKMPKKEYLDKELSPICDFQELVLANSGKTADFSHLKFLLVSYKFPVIPPLPVTPNKRERPAQLTEEEERNFLNQYTDWQIIVDDKPGASGDFTRELYRLFEFNSYEDAWKFICKVDEQAIRLCNHHPRWQNTYNRIEFWLSTFNIGHKPSQRDLELAEILEKIWQGFNKS